MTSSNAPGAASSSAGSKFDWRASAKSGGKSMKKMFNKAKTETVKQKNKLEQRLTMDGLLGQALISLNLFLDPKFLKTENDMIRSLISQAQGIVFVTEVKGGFLFGVKGGSGVIVCRTDENAHINIQGPIKKIKNKNAAMKWSAPCAVGTGGISFGFQAGATKVDHIIILPTVDHIDVFMGKGQLQFGGSASAIVANYGRNADVGMTAGPGASEETSANVAPIVSYSFGVKGLFGGVSLDGEVLKPRLKCNYDFYKSSDVTVKDILTGKTKMPKQNSDYDAILQLLSEYVTGPKLGTYPNFRDANAPQTNNNSNNNAGASNN